MTGVYDEAELYCAAFDFPVDVEVEWLLDRVPNVRRVLEPMCGNARYAHAFIERDVEYVGIDRSSEMLTRATVVSGMKLCEAEATDFDLDESPFDLAFCPIDSIRHLARDGELLAHLKCVRAHLKPDGVYVFEIDLIARDDDQPAEPDRKSIWTIPRDDGTEMHACVFAERCDLAARRVWERSTYRLVRDGETEREVTELHKMRMIPWQDLATAATAAGFAVSEVFEHRSSTDRPPVEAGPHLENTGRNVYVFLRCTSDSR